MFKNEKRKKGKGRQKKEAVSSVPISIQSVRPNKILFYKQTKTAALDGDIS